MTPLYRFACHACGASLSAPLRVLDEPSLLARHESHTWLVGESGFVPARSALVPPGLDNQPGFHGWIAPQPRSRVALHPSWSRTVGCCGLSHSSFTDGNLVCARCGAEVGVGYEDCCGPHWAGLFERVTLTTEEAPDPWPDELGVRCELLRETLDASLPDGLSAPGSDWLRGSASACFFDPTSWDHAPHVEQPALSLAGSADAPELVLTASSFPEGAGLRLPVPFVVLARLALVGEPPYGPPERPLPWQSSDAEGPEVNVARDEATGRVFLGVTGRDANVTLRLDEGAWTGAWRALYAQLGGG